MTAPATLRSSRTRCHSVLGCGLGWVGVLLLTVMGAGCQGGVDDRVAEARALQEIGEAKGAIPILQGVLEHAPAHAEANYLLGVSYVGTGQPRKAKGPLEIAASSSQEQIALQAGLVLSNLLLRTGDHAGAAAAADRVLAADPTHVLARLLRAEAKKGLGDLAGALEEVQAILAEDPDLYNAAVLEATTLTQLGSIGEAEASVRRLNEIAERAFPQRAPNTCTAIAAFLDEQRNDRAAARDQALACLERHPDDSAVLDWVVWVHDSLGQRPEADVILARASDRAPENMALWSQRAQRAAMAGRPEEGERLLRTAAELLDVPGAWSALASYQRAVGREAEARASIERGIESAGSDPAMAPARMALMLAAGRVDDARALADSLEDSSVKHFAVARIHEADGALEEALAELERGLALAPENPAARRHAGRVAAALGRSKEALEHYASAVRFGVPAGELAVARAELLLDLGRFDAAKRMALQSARNRSGTAALYDIAARAALKAGDPEEALRLYRIIGEDLGQRGAALHGLAFVVRQTEGSGAAADEVLAARPNWADRAMRPLLGRLVEDLVEAGRAEEAEAILDAAAAASGDDAGLLTLRARLKLRAGQDAEGRGLLERAIAMDPEAGEAIAALATIEAREGRPEKAIPLYDRAAAAARPEPDAAYYAAQLVLAAGDRAGAEARLRAFVRERPSHANACNDLAWILVLEERDLRTALYMARRAVRLGPDPKTFGTLGEVQIARGRPKLAAAAFEEALRRDSEAISVRYRYALVLKTLGRTDDALRELRRVAAEIDFEQIEEARREIALLEAAEEASEGGSP